jgi:DNA-binding transcriptional MerR regulator
MKWMSASSRYSVEEIKAILESCRDTGVARLRIGNFSVSFLTATPKASQPAAPPTPEQNEAFNVTERENLADLEERLKQDYLMNLRLSDPEEYEDLINRQELTDAGAGPETTLPG